MITPNWANCGIKRGERRCWQVTGLLCMGVWSLPMREMIAPFIAFMRCAVVVGAAAGGPR